jgi:hypothetical protein
LTLSLNIALIYKEKPSHLIIIASLENKITIIINKIIIKGLLNYLTIINKALKKE